jgi:hypothetical protein
MTEFSPTPQQPNPHTTLLHVNFRAASVICHWDFTPDRVISAVVPHTQFQASAEHNSFIATIPYPPSNCSNTWADASRISCITWEGAKQGSGMGRGEMMCLRRHSVTAADPYIPAAIRPRYMERPAKSLEA